MYCSLRPSCLFGRHCPRWRWPPHVQRSPQQWWCTAHSPDQPHRLRYQSRNVFTNQLFSDFRWRDGDQCRFPMRLLQLTVPLPVRVWGVRGLQMDWVCIVGGEQPPPDLSECGRTASSRMWSVGISVVSSEWKQSLICSYRGVACYVQCSRHVLVFMSGFDMLKLSN